MSTVTRLLFILIPVFYTRQTVFAQGHIHCSCSTSSPNSNLSNLIASDPRIGVLISKAKSQKLSVSQDGKGGNKGVSFNILKSHNNKPQQNGLGLQESFNLRHQQPGLTVPLNFQPQSVELLQTLPQQQTLSQQHSANQNLQPMNLNQQAINLQPLKKTINPTLNLPQTGVQKQSLPIDNLQGCGLQTSILSEIPLASIPTVNRQLHGLPSQVFQGLPLPNLGLSSSLPPILSNQYQNPPNDQLSINSQCNSASPNILPISMLDGSQNANGLSIRPSFSPPECSSNIQFQSCPTFEAQLNTQNTIKNQQNLPLDMTFNSINPIQNQHTPNFDVQLQHSIQSTQPIQIQQFIQPLQPQYVQSQPSLVPTVPCQSLEVQSVPNVTIISIPYEQSYSNQPIISQPIEPQPALSAQDPPITQNHPESYIDSVLLSQLLQSLRSSSQYQTNPTVYSSKHRSKSTMKTLLPIIFSLLKEKNFGCCPSNCNCGCNPSCRQVPQTMNPFMISDFIMNNYNSNNFDDNMQFTSEEQETESDNNENCSKQEIQDRDGYANQIKYGLPVEKEVSENCVESEEIETPIHKIPPKKLIETKKLFSKDYQYHNSKKKKNESIEYDDDYDESYEEYEY